MQVDKAQKPEAELYPPVIQTPSRLLCRFGWSEETTHSFLSQQFEQLVLSGGENQEFHIPPLGKKAYEIKHLSLESSGIIEGLEQFRNIEKLYIDFWPKNGLDLSIFPNLRNLSIYQNKHAEKQLPELLYLNEINITGYSGLDCSLFSGMGHLHSLGLVQGRVRSLQGLETLNQLKRLELAYIRNLVDIQALYSLNELEHIELMNLPKVTGKIAINSYPGIKFFYASGTKLVVDLAGLRDMKHLQKLWVNVSFERLHWEDIFMLPDMELVGISAEEGIPEDEEFHLFSERHEKPLKEIIRIGKRKPKGVQLKF